MITVAVLRGGISNEHEVSLRSGANILERLKRDPYRVIDVFIDKNGLWHVRGVPTTPERALQTADVAFNVVHGGYGEDGTLSRILDRVGIPYTGAGALSSALSMNKILTKETLEREGVKMPRHRVLEVSPELEKKVLEIFRTFPQPSIVKPASSGSSVGVALVKSFNELKEAVKKAFAHSSKVMVEEFIKGKEATAGIVEGLRGEKHYKLLPIEIVPPSKADFFDYNVKYNGETTERVPGNFTREETTELQRLAALAHEKLGLRHYSRSDFIVAPTGVYFLETNSAAGVGFTGESLFPKALGAVGISTDEFLDHVINSALQKKT